jgi:transcriptional regulator with XRE-family HTH domain
MSHADEFGALMHRLRIEHGVPLTELERLSGSTALRLSKLERGIYAPPDNDGIDSLCSWIGCDYGGKLRLKELAAGFDGALTPNTITEFMRHRENEMKRRLVTLSSGTYLHDMESRDMAVEYFEYCDWTHKKFFNGIERSVKLMENLEYDT